MTSDLLDVTGFGDTENHYLPKSPVQSYLHTDPDLERYMPRIQPDALLGDLGYVYKVQDEMIAMARDPDELIQRTWTMMYERAVHEVTPQIMGRPGHFVVRYIPVLWRDVVWNTLCFKVTYEIMAVASAKVVIPEFVYASAPPTATGRRMPVEWRCGYCASPNLIAARHCTKCGAPRALLIQEM